MRHIFIILLLGLSSVASGTTYYVSSSSGLDTNNGMSTATAWKTLNQVNNFGSFAAGDVILFKRGDTWNESLIPPTSGTPGSPIAFDAYGFGAAPVFTAAIGALPGTGWTTVTGTVQKLDLTNYGLAAASISNPTVNYVKFGSLYGRKQLGSCSAAIVGKYDWCWSSPFLYVYSTSGNPVTYYGADTPITPLFSQTAGLSLINVSGKSWLTFQHIKVQNFDYVGVGVTGAADNLVFANMESDGIVPAGTTPLGFYVNATNPTSIQFLNDDAQQNYDGFRVDSAGSATAITVINCRGYANRDAGLKDNTPGANHVSYSYSHFYGNNVAQLPSGDVIGGIAGSGNVASSTAPVVANFNMYPARLTFTVDDVGSQPGTETYVNSFLSIFSLLGLKFNVAVVPSYTVDWFSVRNWYGAGNEIDSHSWSHQYYTTTLNPQSATPYPNAPSIFIQYTGTGTAATLSIAGGVLSTTVTGAADSIQAFSLSSYSSEAALLAYLQTFPNYSVANASYPTYPLVRPNTHPANLLNVTSQDIKTAPFALLYDQTKLEPDEMAWSKTAIQANVSGLTETFYVYPDGIEDPTIEADAVAAGYTAARGSLAMKDQNNATVGANSLYSNGVNVENITSLGAIQFHGLSQAQIDSMVASLIFRAAAWGAPYGLFTHFNSRGDGAGDISNSELGYMLNSIAAHGGTLMTNTALATAITAGTNFSGSTRYIQEPTGAAVNLTAAAGSPTIGAGTSAGAVAAYPIDINGVMRTGAWDIGATAYLSNYSVYGQTGSGSGSYFDIGGSTILYASSTATTNPGVISSIFNSALPTSAITSITVSGSTGTIVWSGTALPTGANVLLNGTSQASCNGNYYALTSSTTFAAGTCVTATGGTATQINGCSGDCQNQWRYDTTINSSGMDAYTRMTDGTTFNNGASVGCITVSCGDNDVMFSANETYLGITGSGGTTSIEQITTNSSGAVQVVNTGKPAIRTAGGPFAFDRNNDAVYYNTASTNTLTQYTIANINTQPTGTTVVNFAGTGVCPGVPASAFVGGTAYMHGILTTGYPGQRYSLYVGPDDTAVWALSFDRTLGCAAVNMQTGQYWAFCTGGSCNSSTPATGTLNTAGNSCWGFNIHDGQQTLNEQYYRLSVSITTTPSQGACTGNTNSTQEVVWQIGTANTSWCDGETNSTTGDCGNHPSDGLYSMVSNQFQGSTTRTYPFVAGGFTMYSPSLSTQDIHMSWAHGPGPGVDTMPIVGGSDLVLPAQFSGCSTSAVYCPTWPNNMIVGQFPGAAFPGTTVTFGHTFSCNYTGAIYAHCTGGLADPFGAGEAIGVLSPNADIFCFASSMLGTLGNDNTGVPRQDAFCIRLQ